MKTINESIGYIDENVMKLPEIVDTIVKSVLSGDLIWTDHISDIPDYQKPQPVDFCVFDFHIGGSFNDIKIILVNTDKENSKSVYPNFVINGDDGSYETSLSTISKDNSIGVIAINYNNMIEYKTEKSLKKFLSNILYHELRHYYDHYNGLINNNTPVIQDLENCSDYFYISCDDVDNKTDGFSVLLQNFVYLCDISEINAWYHSFIQLLKSEKEEHPEWTKKDLINYIKSSTDYSVYLFKLEFAFESFEKFNTFILELCKDDIAKQYYYIHKMLDNSNPSTNTLHSLQKVFRTKYIDFFTFDENCKSTDEALEIFKEKVNLFIGHEFNTYIYRKVCKAAKHTINNMKKYIATL